MEQGRTQDPYSAQAQAIAKYIVSRWPGLSYHGDAAEIIGQLLCGLMNFSIRQGSGACP